MILVIKNNLIINWLNYANNKYFDTLKYYITKILNKNLLNVFESKCIITLQPLLNVKQKLNFNKIKLCYIVKFSYKQKK